MNIQIYRVALSLVIFFGCVWHPLNSAAEDSPDFERDIAPILAKRCLECHNARDVQGGLDLSQHSGLRTGGDSGVIVVDGALAESLMFSRIANGEMPPESRGQSQKLPDAEIAMLQTWISNGAIWPEGRQLGIYERTTDVRGGLDWWSLQPLKRPMPPALPTTGLAANSIDNFILAQLKQADMEPAPPADKRTLIRRAYFDLIGLPPTPEQVQEFVDDPAADAYEQLIDRLLQSDHYGERWARYWLDLVRFAETCGYERDQMKPNIWRYRDWVITALNEDLPYDQFVRDQLAGDEVDYRNEQSVIATGMLRAGTWNDEPNDPADYLYTRLEDMVHTTSSAFIGLTVKCARCHDHKFDPIRQTDYYRTASFFWAGYTGQANLGGPDKGQLGYDVFGWTDRSANAEPIKLLIKGERERPGPIVEPGFLSAVPALDSPLLPPISGSKTTTRRLQFANWITDRRNPLTARVMVNRIWQHHFGDGIVRTPNNFGFKSAPPTHPQLLDWLATEFMDGDWKIKRMHKLMMMSNTYRQSSQHPQADAYSQRDFLNRNWWRANRRRLDAEAFRDSMLATSGLLNRQMGGPSFYPAMSPEALEGLSRKSNAWGNSPADQRSRRSIYMIVQRSRLLPLMTTFDFCDTTLSCGQRDVTTVATQALALMNNHFVHEQSDAMAKRVATEAGDDAVAQSRRAWQLTFGRTPTETELESAVQHLESQRSRFTTEAEVVPLGLGPQGEAPQLAVQGGLGLWLRADQGVEVDDKNAIRFWRDQATPIAGTLPHHASQANFIDRPVLVADGIQGKPAVRFDGKRQFLNVAGQVIWSEQFSIFTVATHQATGGGPREIISNWHRRGRSTNSVFLGTSGASGLRFSDAFSQAGNLTEPGRPFILSAINQKAEALTFQNDRMLATSKTLTGRQLYAPYVIGTQGNYNAEWWHGDIAEILVYDRDLDEADRASVWNYLAAKYDISISKPVNTPDRLALASLCHVLLSTNEFIYVD